jgi:carbamoyltransferase
MMDESALLAATSEALAEGKAVGWFQGRMEFGPRALGARSILADPRSPAMQSILNLKVKRRESFRPFAPAVTAEAAPEWFDLPVESPYMLLVADVLRREIPAVTHVDNSARVQTVSREQNPRFHALLRAFEARTGCPVLVNTSFNVRGEPIVCTPEDAYRCFLGTEIEVLAIGDCLLRKEDQPSRAVADPAIFEPD